MKLLVHKIKTASGVEGEAVQFIGPNGSDLAAWCGGTYNIAGKFKGPQREVEEIIQVPSPYIGSLIAFKYDYIVKLKGRQLRGITQTLNEFAYFPFHPAAFNSQFKIVEEYLHGA